MPNPKKVIIQASLEVFADRVMPVLEKREGENALFLGVLERLRCSPQMQAPFMVEVTGENGEVEAAAIYHEINLIVSQGIEAVAEPLALALRERHIDPPGVVGPSFDSERFARTWSHIRGCASFLAMDQGIYQLDQVRWPESVPGNYRLMMDQDVDQVAGWIDDFYREAMPHEPYSRSEA